MGKDNILVTSTLRGDMDSFTELVRSYQNNLYNFLLRMTYSKEDAEEILQDVFFKAYKYLYKYNSRWSFSTWLYRIAVNTFKSNCKKQKKRYESIPYNEIPTELLGTYESNPEISYTTKESYREIIKLFGCLKSDQKIAFLLKYIQDFSYSEIGNILGISEHAAKMKVYRAKHIIGERYVKIKESCLE